MPILKPVIVDDPFAPLAWNASVAVLALEKLSVGELISTEERDCITKILEFVESVLSAYSQSPEQLFASGKDVLASSLLASFRTFAEPGTSGGKSEGSDLEQTAQGLRKLLEELNSGKKMNQAALESVQDACMNLLRNANVRRPAPDQPHYVEF